MRLLIALAAFVLVAVSPASTDSNPCSGITQNTWDFSHLLEPFTGP